MARHAFDDLVLRCSRARLRRRLGARAGGGSPAAPDRPDRRAVAGRPRGGAGAEAARRSSRGCSAGAATGCAPMSVGMPTSTPAFQMAAMYGVRPGYPGLPLPRQAPRGGRLLPAPGRRRRPRRGAARARPARASCAGARLRMRLHRRRQRQPADLRDDQARPRGRGLAPRRSPAVVLAWVVLKARAHPPRDRLRPGPLMRLHRPRRSRPTAGTARDQDRNLGVAARALHAGGLAPTSTRACPRSTSTTSTTTSSRTRGARAPARAAGAPARRRLDPSALAVSGACRSIATTSTCCPITARPRARLFTGVYGRPADRAEVLFDDSSRGPADAAPRRAGRGQRQATVSGASGGRTGRAERRASSSGS